MAEKKTPTKPKPKALQEIEQTEEAPDLSHITPDLWSLARPISDVVKDPGNLRLHGSRSIEAIRGSVAKFTQRKPIVVNKNGVIEAGNGTLDAIVALGKTHVACVFVDDDPVTATAFAIADNRTAELSTWDEPALKLQLDAIDFDVPGVDLDWLNSLASPPTTEQDKAEEEVDTSPQLGDVEFRIMIECTDEVQQAKLLAQLEKEGVKCQALMS